MPSEAWRTRTVAMWVRLSVRCEDPQAGATLYAQLHRFADQIGMTDAGLAEMGWQIVAEPVPDEPKGEPEGPAPVSSRQRLKVVAGGR